MLTAQLSEPPASSLESLAADASLLSAWERVRRNQGAPGVDAVTIDQFDTAFAQHLPAIQSDLLAGTYRPQPVRALDVPKESGGNRTLGIPTVRDRLVLQALAQILTPLWEPSFSPHSFAYRPERSAHDAVAAAQQHLRAGRHWVVDLDIERFFDHVDHVRLMLRLAQRVEDARVLDLIADFLRAGRRREDGAHETTPVGIAQGSPLSPLLANIVLDELDQEYTRLGWPFVRYADDCILLAGSAAEGRAILDFTAGFLADRLKLRLHPHKTRIVQPADTAFLGFTYRLSRYGQVQRHITDDALESFRQRVGQLARPGPGRSFKEIVRRVAAFVRSWSVYYGFCEGHELNTARSFARARLRTAAWELWRSPAERRRQLVRRGVPMAQADAAVHALVLPDALAQLPVLAAAFPTAWFRPYGLGEKGPRPKAVRRKSEIRNPKSEIECLLAYLTGAEFRHHLARIANALREGTSSAHGHPSPRAPSRIDLSLVTSSATVEGLDALAAIQAALERMLGPARNPKS